MDPKSETVILNIDGHEVRSIRGKSILETALESGIYIPHLCHHPDLPPNGSCRLCVVEVDGFEGPVVSCSTPAADGMNVTTRTERLDSLRRLAMELMFAGHPPDCSTCNKYLNCELQSLKQYFTLEDLRVRRRTKPFPIVTGSPLFVHDFSRCVLCGRCVRACHDLRGAGVLLYKRKGEEAYIGTISDLPLAESGCRFCGACAEVCPTGAIMDKEELVKGQNRKKALVPCKSACPAEIDVPRYIRHVREKNYSGAAAVVREKVPFPEVLGYVCKHPCEAVCRRGQVNDPISIKTLKRVAAERDEQRVWEINRSISPDTGRKVAIVGSGPAGLTAAYYLSKQGHAVTVFEALPAAGGMMRYGIPEFRLPREVLDREIADLKKTGVEIRVSTPVESIDDLFDAGNDAVVVAAGTHKGRKPSIPGADSTQVWTSIDFLKKLHLGKQLNIGNSVVVVGGGSVAFDCARVAKRLGAGHVHVACLEQKTEMLASCDEIEEAEAEGILVYPSKSISKVLTHGGKVAGVEFFEVSSFSFDADNNLQLELVEDSRGYIESDSVIFAVGQDLDLPAGFGLDTRANTLVEADPHTCRTSREGVFAAGDAASGAGSLIEAIASGRKCAAAVDLFLDGNGNIEERLAPVAEPDAFLGPGEGFAWLRRCNDPERESQRCLQCDLRLRIRTVKLWGNY
jgi:formate dehydrogenase beta subunit